MFGVFSRPMARRAKTFADRLAPVVPKEEADISHLSDEMVDVLYPGRRPRPFRMGVEFDGFDGPDYARALELARQSPVYRETGPADARRHQAGFDWSQARTLNELYQIVGPLQSSEVTVDGKRVPYAREIWLPLYWIFLAGGE